MDTGLHALVALAHFHQLPAEADQLAEQFGEPGQPFGVTQIMQAAKALTLKARRVQRTLEDLDDAILPAIAVASDGHFFIIARLLAPSGEDAGGGADPAGPAVLIHDLRQGVPRSLGLDELRSLWRGELILLTRRRGLGDRLRQTFDISWFIPSLIKYRALFVEVLIASFFCTCSPWSRRCFSRW